MKLTWRTTNIVGFFIILILFAAALGAQYLYHLNPCPLCIMQRIAYIVMGIIFFVFLLVPQKKWLIKLQGILLFIASSSGLAIAGRQIYLQHLPAGQAPSCGPGLNYLFANFPWHEAVQMVLQGSGECAVVDWQLLGLSMAEWSGIWFVIFIAWSFYLVFKKQ